MREVAEGKGSETEREAMRERGGDGGGGHG